MTWMQILQQLDRGDIDEAEARNRLMGIIPELQSDQIETLISKHREYVREYEKTELTRREYLGTDEGQRALFEGRVQREMGPGGSAIMRRALERRFNPMQALFQLKSGLGQLQKMEGKEQLFSDFLPGARFPTTANLRDLVREASKLLMQPDMSADVLGEQRAGFAEELGSDEQSLQYRLAMQSVLQNVPMWLRNSFKRWASRRFNEARLAEPESQYLPGFVDRGFRFGGVEPRDYGTLPPPRTQQMTRNGSPIDTELYPVI